MAKTYDNSGSLKVAKCANPVCTVVRTGSGAGMNAR